VEQPSVIVQIEEGLNIGVPQWMLEAPTCQAMVLEEEAQISVEGLRQLRDLIDRQTLPNVQQNNASDSMVGNTRHHESPEQSPSPGAAPTPTDL